MSIKAYIKKLREAADVLESLFVREQPLFSNKEKVTSVMKSIRKYKKRGPYKKRRKPMSEATRAKLRKAALARWTKKGSL